jgi:hypothetical protein
MFQKPRIIKIVLSYVMYHLFQKPHIVNDLVKWFQRPLGYVTIPFLHCGTVYHLILRFVQTDVALKWYDMFQKPRIVKIVLSYVM